MLMVVIFYIRLDILYADWIQVDYAVKIKIRINIFSILGYAS